MSTCVMGAVNDLFKSSGWNVHHVNNHISYYKTHFELDRFELEKVSSSDYRVSIPLKDASYSVYVKDSQLYDYLYDRISDVQQSRHFQFRL
jgi:hypothetical protein